MLGSGFIVIFGSSAEVALSSLDIFDPVKCLQSKPLMNYGRKLRTGQREFACNDLAAFLLVEDDFPYNPERFVDNVRRTLIEKGYRSYTSMTAYGYKSKMSDAVVRDFSKAGVRVKLLSSDSEESEEYEMGRKTMLSIDIIEASIFCMDGGNFLVISKPFEFDAMWRRVIQRLEFRGCKLICEQPDYMFTFGSYLWSAKDQLAGSSSLLK